LPLADIRYNRASVFSRCRNGEDLSATVLEKASWRRKRTALRKLFQLNRATTLRDLALLPGNRLEALEGSRKGQYSIRINDQYRICFGWNEGDAVDVEITDYH